MKYKHVFIEDVAPKEEKKELCVGKHNHMRNIEFDPKQLQMGLKVEMEHTDDPAIALAIVKDHLVEISNYYTWLERMEEKARNPQKK